MTNQFFTSTGPTLSENLNDLWIYFGKTIEVDIDDIQTNEIEIINLFKEININKSSAIPNLSSKVLKPACMALVNQFVHLFNMCLKDNTFPDEWKLTIVTPLPKDGNLSKCTNYRPISLLPLPGKNLEQIIHARVNDFCSVNNILNENQGGFRKNKSTTSTVADFTNNLYSNLNQKYYSLATFINFTKAFDTVNHQILFKKLFKLGIRGNVLNLLQNYLKNLMQKTIINNTESDFANISCGVPQGSVLGPLLFLLYINDFCNTVAYAKTFLYADDTVLVTSAPDIILAHIHLQSDLDNVANWCKGNKLSINIKKTKGMVLGTRSMVKRHRFFAKLKNLDKPIDYVYQYKYLGITLDESLTFNNHLKNTIKIVAHKMYMLQKIRQYITEDAAVKISKSMILPYADYGDIFFINANNKQLGKLQTLQNRALRTCLKTVMHTPVEILHQSTQTPMLDKRRDVHLKNFMFKMKNNVNLLNLKNVRTRMHDAPVFEKKHYRKIYLILFGCYHVFEKKTM